MVYVYTSRPGHRSSSPFLQPFRDQSPTCRLIRWEIKNEAPTRVGSPFTANSTHPNVTLRDHVLGHTPPTHDSTCPGMLSDTTVATLGANAHAETASLQFCEMSVTVENRYVTAPRRPPSSRSIADRRVIAATFLPLG